VNIVKTNAVRVLDRLGVNYELREYQVDPTDLSAETVAAKIGLPSEQVFKTLAVQGDRNGIYLAVIPANEELDLKALAHHAGDRKVDMVALKDVQAALATFAVELPLWPARKTIRCISTSLQKSTT
jgi:Cys-tRNA(Pro)/Cys-tRNA(Cys) deacylase